MDVRRAVDADQLVGVGRQLEQIVRHRHHRQVQVAPQPLQQRVELMLRRQVEPGRRLVEQQETSLRTERTRQERALLLAAGELADAASGVTRQPDELDRFVDDAPVRTGREPKEPEAARPAHHDHVAHRHRKARIELRTLRHVADLVRGAAELRPGTFPSTRTSPRVGVTRPDNTRSSVVLPAPFGPMIPRKRPDATVQLDVPQHRMRVDVDGDAAQFDDRRLVRGHCRASAKARAL